MIIDSKTSTPTDPTTIDALLKEPSEMKDFEDGAVVSEYVDIHGITGQTLPLSMGDSEEHPEWWWWGHGVTVCVVEGG